MWVMSTSCPYPLATAASPAKFWVTDLCWSRMAPDVSLSPIPPCKAVPHGFPSQHVFLACQLALAIDVTCPPSGSLDVRRCDLAGTNRSLLQVGGSGCIRCMIFMFSANSCDQRFGRVTIAKRAVLCTHPPTLHGRSPLGPTASSW